jgi:hypothetical protein
MIFDSPVSFAEAVKHLAGKGLMPTGLDSAGIRALDAGLRRQALFSARTLSTELLGRYKETIGSIINPQQVLREGATQTVTEGFDPATARLSIKRLLAEQGYRAEPGEEGTIKDLSSDARINLVVSTNVKLAHGAGRFVQQNADADVVDLWPALEFVRFGARKEPRGWQGVNGLWIQACRRVMDERAIRAWGATGRMVALKSSGVWFDLGNSDYVDGGMDNPYPPFALGSGMSTEEKSREETIELGLLEEGEAVLPARLDLGSLFGNLK